jgi:1-phosphofructokinase
VYVHDRRSGERIEVVSVESRALNRHASDELYGMALGAGLDADVTLVTGYQPSDVVEPDLYRRLVSDLRINGKLVIADLTGPPLRAVLAGGIELLRLNDDELVAEGYATSKSEREIVASAHRLRDSGAHYVLISRGSAPAILVDGDAEPHQIDLVGPVFEPLDRRGTGDSMFAATGVGLARGMSMVDALRLRAAAGALNATRRGLGTGTREEIERLARHVQLRPTFSALDSSLSEAAEERRRNPKTVAAHPQSEAKLSRVRHKHAGHRRTTQPEEDDDAQSPCSARLRRLE